MLHFIIGLLVIILFVIGVLYLSKHPSGRESFNPELSRMAMASGRSMFRQPLNACCSFDMDCESEFCDWRDSKFFSTDCLTNRVLSNAPVGKCKPNPSKGPIYVNS